MANWYTFIGCCEGVLEVTKYRLTAVKPTCAVGKEICAIYLNQTNDVPTAFDAGVQTYIVNALVTQTPQPSGIGIKRFVYLRGPIS